MATLRTIRLRIRGTKSIKQITRAMEAVSAVKMRKSQAVALAARPYAAAALRMLKNLTVAQRLNLGSQERFNLEIGLLERRQVKNTLLVVVSSDKGLAGPFNVNVLKKAEQFIKANTTIPSRLESGLPSSTEEGRKITIAAVGKKARDYFARRGRKPVRVWTGFGDFVRLEEVQPLFEFVHKSFIEGVADEIYIAYTNFLSAMKQEVVVRRLLPFSAEELEEMVMGIVSEKGKFSGPQPHLNPPRRYREEGATPPFQGGGGGGSREYLFEPSPKEIFENLLPALLKVQIYHAILEANASEHSSRMVAMRNATDNAGELIARYTVSLNKARQAAINKELAEITGGSEALTQ